MQHTRTILILAGLALAGGLLSGCRGDRSDKPPRQFFPDLDDSPKFKPQTKSEFFADGRSMRQPVAGTVAFGYSPLVSQSFEGGKPGKDANPEAMAMVSAKIAAERGRLLKDDSAPGSEGMFTGTDRKGEFLSMIPSALAVDAALLDRGMTKFNTYCAVCHGYDGKGGGAVGAAWSYPLPNFYDPKYEDRAQKTGKDGYLFSVVRNGVYGPDGANKMPGYGHAINERDAWAVVAYLRTLQASEKGKMSDVPDAQKAQLQTQMLQGASKPANATPEAKK
jgi:mono/diheme cytochrome c family protein